MAQSPEHRRLVRLAASYNSKARKQGIRGTVTAEDLLWIETSTWGTICHYCGITLEVGQGTFDHVIPLDRGGQNSALNIVRCCLSCNRGKFTKTPAQFAMHQGRVVTCARPGCGNQFQPRFAEYENGRARLCSRRCAALWRWHHQ